MSERGAKLLDAADGQINELLALLPGTVRQP
jgi:hypothetical protein